jgi:hypothetical protein
MNASQLEKTARTPLRWMKLCRGLEQHHINDPGAILCPRVTEINLPIGTELRSSSFFFVPGGRYLVMYSWRIAPGNISVLDLGSNLSTDCRLIASVGLSVEPEVWTTFSVQPTPDGMGLIIFFSNV